MQRLRVVPMEDAKRAGRRKEREGKEVGRYRGSRCSQNLGAGSGLEQREGDNEEKGLRRNDLLEERNAHGFPCRSGGGERRA